jgi:hypothetical protein
MVALLFAILMFASCAYASFAGGREGRWVSLLVISAAFLSIPASYLDYGWHRVQVPVLIVDLLLLGGLLWVSLQSRRFWPLWMTAFHLLSVSTHIARLAEESLPPLVYFALQSFWSLPLFLVMVGGIMLDRRAQLPKSSPRKVWGHEAHEDAGTRSIRGSR